MKISQRIKQIFTPTTILFLTFALLFTLLLRWNSFSAPFERDEGEYAYSAWIMRQGIMPYQNSFIQKPPMIIYTYALGQIFDEEGIVSPRVLNVLFVFAATLVTGAIAAHAFGKKAYWITVFLLSAMLALPYHTPFAANTENFALLPMMGVFYLAVVKRQNSKLLHWFLAGVMVALSLLYKPTGLLLLCFAFAIWAWEDYKAGKVFGKTVLKLAGAFTGAVLITLLVLSPFIVTQTIAPLIEYAITFNSYYIRQWGFGFSAFFFRMGKIVGVYWPLLLLSVLPLILRPKRWWYFTAAFAISLASVYQSMIGHYYIMVMPFFALVVASSILLLSDKLKEGGLRTYSSPLLITSALLVFMIWPFRVQFGKNPQQLSLWIYGTENPFTESQLVAEKVVQNTRPDDCIHIAGSEPQILFYAKRFDCSRFVITYPLHLDTPVNGKYQLQTIQDLSINEPSVLIVSQSPNSGLYSETAPKTFVNWLDETLNEKYYLLGGTVWINGKIYWIEDFQAQEQQQASFLVYKKIEQ